MWRKRYTFTETGEKRRPLCGEYAIDNHGMIYRAGPKASRRQLCEWAHPHRIVTVKVEDIAEEGEKVKEPIYPPIPPIGRFEYGGRIPVVEGKIIFVSEEHYIVCGKGGSITINKFPKEPNLPAPEPCVPKCHPSRDGHHVTIDGTGKNCMEEESGRCFELRNCIHCGVLIENETAKARKDTPAPLKPCPFCGGEAKELSPDSSGMSAYRCRDCGSTSQWSATDIQARAAWNRRMTP